MEIKDVLELLMSLLVTIEKEIFPNKDDKLGYYCGVEYSRNDFKNMKRVLDRIHRYYKNGSKTSYTYIINHGEYNKLMSLQNYYRRKKNKTEKDYEKINELGEKLDIVRQQIKEDKKRKETYELVKQERKRQEEKRKKDLLDKYGFIDDSD